MNYKTTSLSFTELPKPPKPAEPTVQMFRLVCQCNITRSSIDIETMLHTKPVLPVFCVKCRKEYDIQPISVEISLYNKEYKQYTANPHRLAQMKNDINNKIE